MLAALFIRLLKICLLALFLGNACAYAALTSDQVGSFESFLTVDTAVTGKIEILTTSQNALSGVLTYGGKRQRLRAN